MINLFIQVLNERFPDQLTDRIPKPDPEKDQPRLFSIALALVNGPLAKIMDGFEHNVAYECRHAIDFEDAKKAASSAVHIAGYLDDPDLKKAAYCTEYFIRQSIMWGTSHIHAPTPDTTWVSWPLDIAAMIYEPNEVLSWASKVVDEIKKI